MERAPEIAALVAAAWLGAPFGCAGAVPFAEPASAAASARDPPQAKGDGGGSPATRDATLAIARDAPATADTSTDRLRQSGSATPVGWWKLDDGSGTVATDSSRFANDGRLIGARWTTGKTGTAAWFDGDSSGIFIPPKQQLSAPRGTVSAWVKPEASNTVQTIFSSAAPTEELGWKLEVDGGARTLKFRQ